jgi:hypothetical protein
LALSQSDFDVGHGSFIDSGTTLVYAHDKIFNEFMKHFKEYCSSIGGCENM